VAELIMVFPKVFAASSHWVLCSAFRSFNA